MNITLEEAKAIVKKASELGVPTGQVGFSHTGTALVVIWETKNKRGTPSFVEVHLKDGNPVYKGPTVWRDKVLKAVSEITGGNA